MSNTATQNHPDLTLSIIIVSWNACELLATCVQSIYDNLDVPRTEVIVVDNGSDDGSPEMVQTRFPQVRLIENAENRGFAAANNQGLRASRGRYLLLLNSDTEVRPGALRTLVNFLDMHLNVGVVGPKLLNTDGTLQRSSYTFPTVLKEAVLLGGERVARTLVGDYPFAPITRSAMPVDWVKGAALMIRRDVVDAVGELDETFFFYTEETDWCYRVRQAGWLVMYEPGAAIVHHDGGSSGRVSLQKRFRLYGSKQQFFEKHHGRRAARTYAAAVWVSAVVKMLIWQGVAAVVNGPKSELARHNVRSYATLLGLSSKSEGVTP